MNSDKKNHEGMLINGILVLGLGIVVSGVYINKHYNDLFSSAEPTATPGGQEGLTGTDESGHGRTARHVESHEGIAGYLLSLYGNTDPTTWDKETLQRARCGRTYELRNGNWAQEIVANLQVWKDRPGYFMTLKESVISVTVARGDCLDDLTKEISQHTLVPIPRGRMYFQNIGVIGPDPDIISPGMKFTVRMVYPFPDERLAWAEKERAEKEKEGHRGVVPAHWIGMGFAF